MSATMVIEFDDLTEHSFDANVLELANDQGVLKSQVLASEILFSNFDTDADNVSKRGDKTLVFEGVNNTGAVIGGLLKFPNEDRSIASYKNITSIVDDFSFKMRVESNILTTVQEREIARLVSNVDSSEIRFFLQNQGAGVTRVRRDIINSAGALVSSIIIATADLSVMPNYNIAFSNEGNIENRTYFNGALIDTVTFTNLDFSDCDLILGDNTALGRTASSNYDNIQLWNADVIQDDFAFPFPESTTLSIAENIMLTAIPFIVDEILDFSVINSIPANTQLKHFICIDNKPYYFDGTNWLISDKTLAQANTVAEIKTNLAALPLIKGIGSIVQFAHIYKSDLGYATPAIESLTTKFKLQFKPDAVKACIVTGTVLDNNRTPVEGATVRVDSDDKFYNGAFVGPSSKVLTDSMGNYSIGVVETATSNTTADFYIEYKQKKFANGVEFDEQVVFPYLGRIVPDLPTKKLSELLLP